MTRRDAEKATMIAAFLAAALALSAAIATYARRGELAPTPAFGGLFLLALGLGAWSRLRGAPGP